MSEEVVDQVEDQDLNTEQPAEGITEEVPETPVEESVEETISDEDFYKDLSQRTGLEISSDDQIEGILKEYQELKGKDPLEGLDPFVKDIAKAKSAGLDVDAYISARSLDVDALEGKNALFQQYKLDNADTFKRDSTFAKKKFEREFKAKYGEVTKVLDRDSFDDEADYQRAIEDQEFAKMSLQEDQAKAREDLKKWQEENVTIPEDEKGLSTEELEAKQQAYNAQVNSTLENTKGIEIPVGDEKFLFKIGEEGKQFVQDGLSNPEKALTDVFGIDLKNSVIDTDKLRDALAFQAAFSNKKLGEALKKYAIEKYNKETFEASKDNPREANSLSSAPETKTQLQKIAEGFASARN